MTLFLRGCISAGSRDLWQGSFHEKGAKTAKIATFWPNLTKKRQKGQKVPLLRQNEGKKRQLYVLLVFLANCCGRVYRFLGFSRLLRSPGPGGPQNEGKRVLSPRGAFLRFSDISRNLALWGLAELLAGRSSNWQIVGNRRNRRNSLGFILSAWCSALKYSLVSTIWRVSRKCGNSVENRQSRQFRASDFSRGSRSCSCFSSDPRPPPSVPQKLESFSCNNFLRWLRAVSYI